MQQKVAMVTGTTRGLGRALAVTLAEQGWAVVCTGRRKDKCPKVPGGAAYALDVTDPNQISQVVDAVLADFGRIDVLINNAGVLLESSAYMEPTPEQANLGSVSKKIMMETFEANAVGPFLLCQKIFPIMRKQKSGRIVNVSSELGRMDWMEANYPAYRVSKVALNAITKMFASMVEPHQEDIRINSVSPGWVRTEMGGPEATRSIAEGVASILWAATIEKNGPNGGFFVDGNPVIERPLPM